MYIIKIDENHWFTEIEGFAAKTSNREEALQFPTLESAQLTLESARNLPIVVDPEIEEI